MFDRLIESDTAGAEFKSRRRYFLVSSVVVGALFVSAVVFSIYASEVGLGADQFEVAAILAPVEIAATQPEPPRATVNRTTDRTSDVPQRPTNTQRPEESPSDIPPISTVPSNVASRPNMPFRIGELRDPPSSGDFRSDLPQGIGTGSDNALTSGPKEIDREKSAETKSDPPPLVEKPKPPRSIGVANGYATYLPKPEYPRPALTLGLEGKVDVQITIDETGRVVSAKAVNGHPFFKQVAEKAAMSAKFKPTTLSNVPVKVTGIIVYNFTRN